MTRIAVVNDKKCKPKKCGLECKKICPVVRMGKKCIEVTNVDKIAKIEEGLCTGCNICTKQCPFGAINIINLPEKMEKEVVHRYGKNGFQLHRLPIPKQNQIMGLLGQNGIGKSTILKILAGKIIPNFGREKCETYEEKEREEKQMQEIIKYYRGTELQSYFERLRKGIKVSFKPQHIEKIPKVATGKVKELLTKYDERKCMNEIIEELELENILEREVDKLSGGELQRFTIALAIMKKADLYVFDEPSSYLDIKQRIKVSKLIRSIVNDNTYVIIVEHDLSILDFLSDYICCIYGEPGAYGIVTHPYSVKEAINIFLDGYLPSENVRFRKDPLNFKLSTDTDFVDNNFTYNYPSVTKTYPNFSLNINNGSFRSSQITGLVGQNGTGKTTFLKLLAGKELPDPFLDPSTTNIFPTFNVSYKPQIINPNYNGTVRDLFHSKIKSFFLDSNFRSEIISPLKIDSFIDTNVNKLSGGELQRVALIICLATPADIYLIDEPSAYLDVEQRIIVSKIIKRFILNHQKVCFVVEHDFLMLSYLSDQIIVYEGTPSLNCSSSSPLSISSGLNLFLQSLDITFRSDSSTNRPRINKHNSVLHSQQKSSGNYFISS